MRDRVIPCLLFPCLLLTGCPDRDKTPSILPAAKERVKPQPVSKPTGGKAQCTSADQCTFRRKGCCYQCRETTLAQIEALTHERNKVIEKNCSKADGTCLKCTRGRGFNPNYVELCEQGRCVVRDIRQTAFSVCDKDTDCRLATKICCDCYAEPVAVGSKGEDAFHKWKCSEGQDCEPCDAPDHVGLSVACVKGHCVIKGTWDKARERPAIRGFIK